MNNLYLNNGMWMIKNDAGLDIYPYTTGTKEQLKNELEELLIQMSNQQGEGGYSALETEAGYSGKMPNYEKFHREQVNLSNNIYRKRIQLKYMESLEIKSYLKDRNK